MIWTRWLHQHQCCDLILQKVSRKEIGKDCRWEELIELKRWAKKFLDLLFMFLYFPPIFRIIFYIFPAFNILCHVDNYMTCTQIFPHFQCCFLVDLIFTCLVYSSIYNIYVSLALYFEICLMFMLIHWDLIHFYLILTYVICKYDVFELHII